LITKRVIVGTCGLLLGAAIESLLTLEPDLDVIGVETEDEAELHTAIELYQPDVVILGECITQRDTSLLPRLIIRYPGLSVITLDHEDNWMHLYQKQDILIVQSSDLANLIRAN